MCNLHTAFILWFFAITADYVCLSGHKLKAEHTLYSFQPSFGQIFEPHDSFYSRDEFPSHQVLLSWSVQGIARADYLLPTGNWTVRWIFGQLDSGELKQATSR